MILKENVSINYAKYQTIINYGTQQFEIEDPTQYYFNLLNQGSFKKDSELFQFLKDNNLIVDNYATVLEVNNKQYERTIHFWANSVTSHQQPSSLNDLWNTLNQDTVMIVGVGGVGTVVLQNLITAGVQNFILVDGDKVDHSNLNRQLYFDVQDVNSNKISTITDKIKSIYQNSNINILGINEFIHSKAHLLSIIKNSKDTPTIIINCADTPNEIETIVFSAAQELRIPVLGGYVGQQTGTVTAIFDQHNVFVPNLSIESKRSLKGSASTTNMMISSLIAKTTLDYLIQDYIEINYDFYKSKTFNFNSLTLKVAES